jgi:hypothetical protein
MNKEFIFYGIYTLFIIIQITTSSYFIHNYNNYDLTPNECNNMNSPFYSIYIISKGMLTTAIAIILTFILFLYADKFINKSEEEITLLNNNLTKIKEMKLSIYTKFYITIQLLFVLAVLSFIILNGVDFVYQLNNIDEKCLNKINENNNGFYVLYKLMLTIAFLSSYGLFIIIPIIVF